ncbi:hypothetical protein Scep_007533 [Stephania cephalantha]|uniref:Origin recognition complex subunit 5 C-terminal domain-containing protein n=1 Tax=Stephania cephalantha TaxID=152367 RepID=A0AAP0KA33_9MAGN
MSVSVKYRFICAFLASRNQATLDAALFHSTGGGDYRKRKRRISEASKEKKEIAEEELPMKRHGTFPLERLRAIFQCITSVIEDSLDEGEQESNSDLGAECGNAELMFDVLLQLSTLCNANFISKGGTCPLEASTQYQSTVTEELNLKIKPLCKVISRQVTAEIKKTLEELITQCKEIVEAEGERINEEKYGNERDPRKTDRFCAYDEDPGNLDQCDPHSSDDSEIELAIDDNDDFDNYGEFFDLKTFEKEGDLVDRFRNIVNLTSLKPIFEALAGHLEND